MGSSGLVEADKVPRPLGTASLTLLKHHCHGQNWLNLWFVICYRLPRKTTSPISRVKEYVHGSRQEVKQNIDVVLKRDKKLRVYQPLQNT